MSNRHKPNTFKQQNKVNIIPICLIIVLSLGIMLFTTNAHANNDTITMHVGITLKPPEEGLKLPGVSGKLKHAIEDMFATHTGGPVSRRFDNILVQIGDVYKTGLSTQVCAKVIVFYEVSNVALAGEVCKNEH